MIVANSLALSGQISDTANYKDFVIRTTKINFLIDGQNYPYTLFVERDGLSYFNESFDIGEPNYRFIFESKKFLGSRTGTKYKDVFIPTTDSIITIESQFPKFITHDSSFINEYPYEYSLKPFIYELRYSYLLQNFGEPSIYSSKNKKIIRVIVPEEGIKHSGRYSIYRLEFGDSIPTLTYKTGEFDSSGTFRILKSNRCIVSTKSLLLIEKAIGKIRFEEEYYFLKANLEEKFFVEYKIGNDYYAIQRPIDQGDYKDIYWALYAAYLKCKK